VSEDLFSFVADHLELRTPLDRLESRGTLRLVLKQAGLEAKRVSREQFCVILESLVPRELEIRGVTEAQAVCAALTEKIQAEPADRWEAARDVDGIFERLAGN
jgi:hypothetical protein